MTNARLIRWALQLNEYQYDIEYKKGKLNVHVDMLSTYRRQNIKGRRTNNTLY